MKLHTTIFHKIVFAHTKFGLIRIKGSGVKVGKGGGFRLPGMSEFLNSSPDRVKSIKTSSLSQQIIPCVQN